MAKRKNYSLAFFAISILLFSSVGFTFQTDRMAPALSHYIMAVMYEDLGELDNAIREYESALKKEYEFSLLHLRLGCAYIKKNQIPKAISELNLALKFDPDAVEPHAILALLYSTQNNEALATQEYERAFENASKLDPQNVDIYKTLGALYLKQKKLKEAEDSYRLATKLAPADAESFFYLANVYNALEQNDLAEKELLKTLELDPDFHPALNFLGYLYVEANKNLDRAESMIRKALELEPQNGAYVDSLGWLYFQKGMYQEALKELERANTLVKDPVVLEHLGDAYHVLGDDMQAKEYWRQSLELEPAQEKVKEKLHKTK